MPPGGDGFYYFSVFLSAQYYKFSFFDIQTNGTTLCTVYLDQADTFDESQASCSVAVYVTEGWCLNHNLNNTHFHIKGIDWKFGGLFMTE